MVATRNRIGRNEQCPCRSGKKFKKCCAVSSASPNRSAFPSAAEPPTATSRFTRFPHATESSKKWNEVIFDTPLKNGGRLHAVLLYSDGGLNASLLREGEDVTLDLPDVRFRGPAVVAAIRPSSAKGDVEAEVVRVVHFRDDDDLGKALYGKWKPPQDFIERWAGRRRRIVMRMDFPDEQWCDIRLIRTLKWMAQHGVRVGGKVFLDLTDVGVRGWANVLEILPCPLRTHFGAGEMVTGTFKFSHGRVGELVLESEPKPIGVTPSHLFWSEDRRAWVEVSKLRPGETLKTIDGVTRVVSFTMTDRIEAVYNIEVAHDHCYRVGESRVLVHNQSAPNDDDECDKDCVVDDGTKGPYVALEQKVLDGKEKTTIASNLPFAPTPQKKRIRKANSDRNGGKLISDCYPTNGTVPSYCGPWVDTHKELVMPLSGRFMGGKSRPLNEAQVDHIKAQSTGGSNSYCNAVLISFELNNRKRAQ